MNQISKHCQRRMQQRSIPAPVIELVLDYGVWVRSHGAYRVYLDKVGRAAIRRDRGELLWRTTESKLGAYAIVADCGNWVMCAHRTRRLHRP